MGRTLGYGEITVANVTEPFTVMLTNEAQQFATDSNRKVTTTQSYYTDIIVMRGSQQRTNYTIGNVTSANGITVSKSATRVTFSVSAGSTIGADAGTVIIPITLDGQTVNKTFSWSCGKQGVQGIKGNDGTSVTITSKSVTYQTSASGTTTPTGSWSTSVPTVANGQYLWTKTTVQYSDGNKTEAYSVSYKGTNGTSVTVSKNEVTYQVSASGTTTPTGTWSTTMPSYGQGQYLWTKTYVKYSDGKETTSYAVSYKGNDGKGVAETIQYYLATSSATGVTFSTSGWSTDITTQKITADKKYLWNCFQTKYTDGTSDPVSTPKIIGVYGDKGQKGDNAKSITITPSSQIFKSTDGGNTFAPNTITITPTIQGGINVGKWQYSIDGGVSFADVVSGQKGLSVSNNVLSVSKNSSLYTNAVTMVTFRAIASDSAFYDTCSIAKLYDVTELEMGGVNLFVKATVTKGYWLSNIGDPNADNIWGYSDYIDVSRMKNYIASGFTNLGISPATCFYDSNKAFVSGVQSENQNSQDSKRRTLPIPSNAKYMRFSFALADIDTLKIEQGTKATAYSQSPQDVQTAILSTKSEISSVSSKVDQNAKAITNKVENTTYQNDLKLVKGDISKANDGLNKWRYEIYPKSLFASDDQGKSELSVFARNKNLVPSQTVLIDDVNLGIGWNYGENYIGYAVTFVKMSNAKSVNITFAHDDGAHVYLNGKLIGGSDANNATGESLTLGFIKGWNCIEVVVNEKTNSEGFKFGTTISTISECQLMNCYYAMITGRESQITNTLVQTVTDLNGVNTKVGKVTSVIGENGEKYNEFKNDYSDFKQTMDGFKTTVGQTYVTKNEFNGLEIGGRNILENSSGNLGNTLKWSTAIFSDDGYGGENCIIARRTSGSTTARQLTSNDLTTKIESMQAGESISISGWYYVESDIELTGTNNQISLRVYKKDNSGYLDIVIDNITSATAKDKWIRFEKNANIPYENTAQSYFYIAIHAYGSIRVSQIMVERGNKATNWTPAPEDIDSAIFSIKTIAEQTADKFSWIVQSGTSSTDFTLTDRTATLIANQINLKGLVSFNGLNSDAKTQINNNINNAIAGLEIGGRNLLLKTRTFDGLKGGVSKAEETYKDLIVRGQTLTTANTSICEYIFTGFNYGDIYTFSFYAKGDITSLHAFFYGGTGYVKVRPIACSHGDINGNVADGNTNFGTLTSEWTRYWVTWEIAGTGDLSIPKYILLRTDGSSVGQEVYVCGIKFEHGNKATDWTPAPEDTQSQIDNVADIIDTNKPNWDNAYSWINANGASQITLLDMVKVWTGGAISKTTQVNGGWIKTNTITADKIAIGDFTNYAQLNDYTLSQYGWTKVTDSSASNNPWYQKATINRDMQISNTFRCNGGESFRLKASISTTIKGASTNGGTDSVYRGVAVGIFTENADGTKGYFFSSRVTNTTSDVSSVITIPSTARSFRVYIQIEGYPSFSGTLKVRNVQVIKMSSGELIVDGSITAGKIATNAIKSRNYSYLSGNYSTAGTFLDLSDGKIISKNFSIDGSGNAYFKGKIESSSGLIGGWDINNGYLSKGTWGTTNGMLLCPGGSSSSKSIGGSGNISGWTITASNKFGVTKDGKLYASDGMFSGTINASKGIIGANGEGFYISNSGLYATYSSNIREKSTRYFSFSKPSTNNFDFVFTYDNIDNDIVDKNNGIKESRINYFRVNIEYSYSQTVTNSESANDSNGDETTTNTDATETITDTITIDIDTSKLVLSNTNVSESGNILTYTLSYYINYGSGYTNVGAYIQSLLSSYSSDYVLQSYSFSSSAYVLFNNVNTYACVSVKQLKYGQVFEVDEDKVVAKNLEVKDSAITVISNSYQSTLSNDCLTLQSLTVNSNSYSTVGSNPSILFKNGKGDQNLALVYTDYDSVKAPSCLTLTGNQGGEYFIAPNVQVRNKLYIGSGGSNIYYAVVNKKKNLYYHTQGYHSFYVNGKGIAWIQYNGINMNKNIMFRDNQGITASDHSNWYMLRCYDGANHTNTVALGNSHLSTSVYTTSSVWYNGSSSTKLSTTSSDKRLKENFVDISKYEDVFMDLKPITYKFHDGLYNVKGTKPLRTWGFIADQVIDSFNKNGLDWKDEELVTIDRDGEYTEEELKYVDNHTMLKMNYQNMISLNTHMIQKTRKELEQVKQEKTDLEARLQAIEAKLGL